MDDILVHKVADDHYFLCVNASNQEKDFEHIRAHNRFDAEVEFAERALRADRHPGAAGAGHAAEADAAWTWRPIQLLLVRRRRSVAACRRASRAPATPARTASRSTSRPQKRRGIWNEVLDAGAEFGIKPCGLGARNTLRLEAKMALYGHEIDASITPLEAELAWIVKLDKGDFVGREALLKQKEAGIKRKLVGFEMRGRGIGRDGYEVLAGRRAGGLGHQRFAFAHAEQEHRALLSAGGARADRAEAIQIMIRNQPVDAVTVETPFYKRAK